MSNPKHLRLGDVVACMSRVYSEANDLPRSSVPTGTHGRVVLTYPHYFELSKVGHLAVVQFTLDDGTEFLTTINERALWFVRRPRK